MGVMTNGSFRCRPKAAFAGLGTTILALALTACGGGNSSLGSHASDEGGTPRRGGTLTVGEDTQPLSGLDPIMAQAFNAKRMAAQFYEGLLSLSADGTSLAPGLATSWKQLSPLQYTFTLRKNVKFHDGQTLTPEDVVFSLNRIVDPAQASPYRSLYSVKSVKVADPQTVQVDLSKPQASLLRLLAQPWSGGIVNEQWTTSKTPNELKTQENGTGPFKLSAFQEGSIIKTVRFADYWDSPKPYLDAVNYRLIPTEATRIQAVSAGSVDMIQAGIPKNVEALKSKGLNVGPEYDVGSYWLGLDTTKGALASEKVREAISVGLDRRQLMEVGSQGTGTLAFSIPPSDPLGTVATESAPFYKYDPARAKQLLTESGVANVHLKMVLNAEGSASTLPTAQLMKQQLGAIGVDLEIQVIPFSTLVSNLLSGNWNADMMQLSSTLNADASQYLALWYAEGSPATKVNDPKLWQMMADAQQTTKGDAARKAMYLDISNYIAQRVYQIVPYASSRSYDVWTAKLHGFKADVTATRGSLKNAWLG